MASRRKQPRTRTANHGAATLDQVARAMGVSREHVRRIEKRALDKLRLELEKKGIYKSEEVSF